MLLKCEGCTHFCEILCIYDDDDDDRYFIDPRGEIQVSSSNIKTLKMINIKYTNKSINRVDLQMNYQILVHLESPLATVQFKSCSQGRFIIINETNIINNHLYKSTGGAHILYI